MGRIKTVCGEWGCRHEFGPETVVTQITRHAIDDHAGGQPILRLAVKCPNCEDERMRMTMAINATPPRQEFYCDACSTRLVLPAGA